QYFSGLEEAVVRNIKACKEFAQSVRSAYGPNGMNKMVINHIEKQFVTSDAATIIRELDVEHPAARLMILASQMQDSEVGDGTNFVIILAGALLDASEELIRLGVTPTEIAEGFEKGLERALEILKSLVCYTVKDNRDVKEVTQAIKTSIESKQYGNEDFLADLVARACISILPEQTSFNVDNMRVCKILGSGLLSSQVVQGMVIKGHVEGEITQAEDAKIAIYSCPVDILQTETKGTVLIKTADELMNFSRGEENLLELQIKSIADAGTKVIVAGDKFGDMALHYVHKYNMMAVKFNSQCDLRQLSKTVNGTVLPKLSTPSPQELGYCDLVCVEELGDTPIVAFRQKGKESRISTILIRGASDNYMDDIERAIDDGVNTFKGLSRDPRFVPGAGATEAELAVRLLEFADTLPGLEQYAIRKFATALEAFPKALADNSGLRSQVILEKILDAHLNGQKNVGVDITAENSLVDVVEKQIFDLYQAKFWGLKYTKQVNAKLGNENKELLNAAEFIRNWFSKFYLCMDPAEDLAQVSVNSLVKYRECEGNHLVHWKTNGFASFFNVLLENNPKSFLTEHVLLNKEVIKIVWDQTGDSKDRGKVKLFCADSSRFTADHVILTVSIGVLKETYQTLFKPSLPLCKINCLETIPMGTCQKIIIKFPNKWWPDEVKDFSFVWTDEDKKTLPKEFPFGPIRNERSWLEDIFGFYTVDSDPNILLGWLVGSMVKEVELLSDELLMNASLFLLRKFAGEIYKISEPSEIIRSKWGTNPHFLGTYSYVGVEMEAREATREDLAKPLVVDGKEVVLFAGEATHSCYFSTVHGAVESGWREADRLIERSYKSRRHKVVIVGAGIAGLAAATKLLENKIDDFLLLEAQEEAGGRIKTVQIGNKPIDLGAQWMHGKSNPLYDLAKEKQLISDEMSEEGLGLYVRSNGKIVDKFMVDKVAFKVGQILEGCSKLVSENSGCTALGTILEQHFFRYLEEHVPDESEAEVMKELYDWHVRFQVIDNSCKDLSKLSAKRWADYVCLDDEAHANMKHGYQSLVQLLLDGLPDNQVKFNTEVTKISFSPQSEIKLDLLAGGSIVCEHLILTPSLGVLKEFQGLSNVLPESLMVNIANMGFASICKVYLFYDRKWWGDSQGFQLLWSSDHNATWQRHITGFDEVFNHENTLMTWVGGDSVREVERLPAEEVGKQCTELLRTFLPNYSVPEPMEVIRTQWLSNPFIKGSYSHITPECDDCNAGINALKQPVLVDGVPRILLAGEAIHSSHYSTTHGAYESGLDQAQVLCDFLLENKPAI
ncbi:hypothetical protein D910_03332, partial [Dendroctonus ponderosae]